LVSSLISLSKTIEKSARDIENTLNTGTKIAVVNIASPSEAFSLYVMEELTNSFVNGKKLIVAERRELDIIRNELAFQYSGDVSDESIQSIGRILGAQTIISGSIIKIDNVYRFRVNAINVETAVRVASSSLDLFENPVGSRTSPAKCPAFCGFQRNLFGN
jgi:TolB-like protein